MYGKIFGEIFDSSLMAEGGWLPTYIFMSMNALSEKDGTLRIDKRVLYRKLGLNDPGQLNVTPEQFESALNILLADDPHSNLKGHNGRRILPLSELDEFDGDRGWFIVNHQHYREKGGDIERRRTADRDRKRKERQLKNNNLEAENTKCHVTSQDVTTPGVTSAHTDTDTDTEKDAKTTKKKPSVTGDCLLKTALTELESAGEYAIPPGDPIFKLIDAGISKDMIEVCWWEFKRRYTDPDAKQVMQKGVKGWRAHFRNAVRRNWYKLWWAKPGQPADWSATGIQMQNEYRAERKRANA